MDFNRARGIAMLHPRFAEHTWPLVDKAWGQTRAVHRNFEFHVEEIFVKPGGFCSWHKHAAKHNRFMVSAGKLAVFTGHSQSLRSVECWLLNPGETCLIENNRWHVFAALWGECHAIETYTRAGDAIVAAGDIVRASDGGLLPQLKDGVPWSLEHGEWTPELFVKFLGERIKA